MYERGIQDETGATNALAVSGRIPVWRVFRIVDNSRERADLLRQFAQRFGITPARLPVFNQEGGLSKSRLYGLPCVHSGKVPLVALRE